MTEKSDCYTDFYITSNQYNVSLNTVFFSFFFIMMLFVPDRNYLFHGEKKKRSVQEYFKGWCEGKIVEKSRVIYTFEVLYLFKYCIILYICVWWRSNITFLKQTKGKESVYTKICWGGWGAWGSPQKNREKGRKKKEVKI